MDTRKRVLFFISEFPVLSETFIEREVACLAKRGILDVQILSLKKSSVPLSEILTSRTHYQKLSYSSFLNGLFYSLQRPHQLLSTFSVLLKNQNRSFIDTCYIFLKSMGYSDIVRKFNPDFILCHFLSEPSTIILTVSLLTSIPFAISAHARDVFGLSEDKKLNAELVNEKTKYAKFVVLCNNKAFEKCCSLVSENEKSKIHLNYHGIDFESLDNIPRPEYKETQTPYIFSIGRLVKKKGFEFLIDASKELKNSGINHVIKIAGPGPLYRELLDKIIKNELSDSFYIIGDGEGASHEISMSELQKADIFILPSIETEDGDAEGIPNTILEAGYFKKPIITTSSGSITEFIKNNENGLLVDQKNSHQLSEAIKYILNNREVSKTLGNTARKDVLERFDLSKNIVFLEKLIINSI